MWSIFAATDGKGIILALAPDKPVLLFRRFNCVGAVVRRICVDMQTRRQHQRTVRHYETRKKNRSRLSSLGVVDIEKFVSLLTKLFLRNNAEGIVNKRKK